MGLFKAAFALADAIDRAANFVVGDGWRLSSDGERNEAMIRQLYRDGKLTKSQYNQAMAMAARQIEAEGKKRGK